MKTKQDLLDRMAALRACPEATAWVTEQEGSALEIGLACDTPNDQDLAARNIGLGLAFVAYLSLAKLTGYVEGLSAAGRRNY